MSRRELAGRALMWLAVLSAAGAAGTALLTVLDAGGATKAVETWRMFGLVVFTGLFVLLMLHPKPRWPPAALPRAWSPRPGTPPLSPPRQLFIVPPPRRHQFSVPAAQTGRRIR